MMVVMWDMIFKKKKERRGLRMIIRCLGWRTDSIYCHEKASKATSGSGVLK